MFFCGAYSLRPRLTLAECQKVITDANNYLRSSILEIARVDKIKASLQEINNQYKDNYSNEEVKSLLKCSQLLLNHIEFLEKEIASNNTKLLIQPSRLVKLFFVLQDAIAKYISFRKSTDPLAVLSVDLLQDDVGKYLSLSDIARASMVSKSWNSFFYTMPINDNHFFNLNGKSILNLRNFSSQLTLRTLYATHNLLKDTSQPLVELPQQIQKQGVEHFEKSIIKDPVKEKSVALTM